MGASLYVPATRDDLLNIADRRKFPLLRSVIFCTEDSISPSDVSLAVANIEQMLISLQRESGFLRFVRVRNPEVLARLLDSRWIDNLDGFVLPKISRSNIGDYLRLFRPDSCHWLMPTLESSEVFDQSEMRRLCDQLQEYPKRHRVMCLRIGGNDLLRLLNLRRRRGVTVYETPLGAVISQLVTIFHVAGFYLTAPVFERFDDSQTLFREVEMDLDFGLCGKTAVHPMQVPMIESQYAVKLSDLVSAECILDKNSPAVFRHDDAMCEPATHEGWACMIRDRARIYGVTDGSVKNSEFRGGAHC